MKRAAIISLIAGIAFGAHAQNRKSQIDIRKLADAIYRAEGGADAKVPYGILTVKVHSAAEARQVCLRTIENAWHDYSAIRVPRSAFIDFLAARYCPFSADPIGNRNWRHNVKAILRQS